MLLYLVLVTTRTRTIKLCKHTK